MSIEFTNWNAWKRSYYYFSSINVRVKFCSISCFFFSIFLSCLLRSPSPSRVRHFIRSVSWYLLSFELKEICKFLFVHRRYSEMFQINSRVSRGSLQSTERWTHWIATGDERLIEELLPKKHSKDERVGKQKTTTTTLNMFASTRMKSSILNILR